MIIQIASASFDKRGESRSDLTVNFKKTVFGDKIKISQIKLDVPAIPDQGNGAVPKVKNK